LQRFQSKHLAHGTPSFNWKLQIKQHHVDMGPALGYGITTIQQYWIIQIILLMTHKYRGSQQSSREVKPKFIDSTQGEPKDIYKP
jgi:hypothetical protein